MTLTEQAVAAVQKQFMLQEDTPAVYAAMKYPKLLPMMHFTVHRYRADGFGTIMTMDTNAMFGMMRLSTLVFTPAAGATIPFLLIDTMQMKKKSLAYVEYYDCTQNGATLPGAEDQPKEFAAFPDYAEKSAWYVARRTPYSLIKKKGENTQQQLDAMVLTCLERYLAAAKTAPKDPANITGLRNFQQEMLAKGNPSSTTMNKVLGEAGARIFFETVIMPVDPV